MLRRSAHPLASPPDFVRSFDETAAIMGICTKTLRNMIARGEGPKVTQISPKRKGIRDTHRIEYLEAQAMLSEAERQAGQNIRVQRSPVNGA
jgi:hypothetical protein